MLNRFPVVLLALLLSSAPLAEAHADRACPYESEEPRELLDLLVQKVRDYESFQIPEEILRALKGDVRPLEGPDDRMVCQHLNGGEAGKYLYEYWDDDQGEGGQDYLRYEVGYFQSGDYYFVAVTQTPTPQPEDLGWTRVVMGYDQLMVYDRDLNKIMGWAL